jgi:hypothetical protein
VSGAERRRAPANRSAAETNSLDRSSCRQNTFWCILGKSPFFRPPSEKNDPHIRVLAAFPGSGWGKLSGEIHLAITCQRVRCKSALFCQTGRKIGLFSTRTEKGRFMRFSGFNLDVGKRNGA